MHTLTHLPGNKILLPALLLTHCMCCVLLLILPLPAVFKNIEIETCKESWPCSSLFKTIKNQPLK